MKKLLSKDASFAVRNILSMLLLGDAAMQKCVGIAAYAYVGSWLTCGVLSAKKSCLKSSSPLVQRMVCF
jgi:hypothetical protein